MKQTLSMPVIGILRSPFHEKFGIPRQPNLVQVPAIIDFFEPYNTPQAFAGLKDFSHVWLIWSFHQNKDNPQEEKFRAQIRPPRLGGNQKIGVFASRSMYRPSQLGLSVVRLLDIIEQDGQAKVLVDGVDLLDGTPIIDIKPYITYSDAIAQAQSGFAAASPDSKQVLWCTEAQQEADSLVRQSVLSAQQCRIIEQLLALDPRPAYQDDANRVYGMRYDQVNVLFVVAGDTVHIQSIACVAALP